MFSGKYNTNIIKKVELVHPPQAGVAGTEELQVINQ